MVEFSRRALLRMGSALGVAGTLPRSIGTAVASSEPTGSASSPELAKFVQPLPIPEVRSPDGVREGADYHNVPVTEFTQQFHPDLPETTVWGFDGVVPGPIIEARENQRLKVEFDNSRLPTEHLLSVDERIHGTSPKGYPGYDGPVPEVRTVTHFHGANIEPESDGQAADWTSPDGVEGPGFVKPVHDIPNRQSRLSSTYHDHALGISRLNVYAGLAGFYFVRSRAEERLGLPSGEYDVPLMLQDRTFEEDGSLHYPESFVPNVKGDTAVVNGAVWPYLEVEPRRYRLRLINQSNGRTFNMRLASESDGDVPLMHQFAPDQGFLPEVVPIGPSGTLDSLTLSPFERAEVIVDFSDHAGETFTVTNDAEFPYEGENSGSDLEELLQFRVTAPDELPTDTSADPTALDLPDGRKVNPKAAKRTREMTLNMIRDEYGLATHLLNKSRWTDESAVVYPQLGTTEIWEFENVTMHTHPIHMHLVTFEVLGRGPDGTEPPSPSERGEKDVVRVNPGETVRIAVRFRDFTGRYPWHCHVLEHEDHEMMLPFEVVSGKSGENRGGRGEGGN